MGGDVPTPDAIVSLVVPVSGGGCAHMDRAAVGDNFLCRRKILAGALAVLRIHGIDMDVIFDYSVFGTLIQNSFNKC